MQTTQLGAEHFSSIFDGDILRPGEDGFSEARELFNMRAKENTPQLIARARNDDDVVAVMKFATETRTPIAIRSGGHGIDGEAMPDGAIVLDLSQMKDITVDKEKGLIKVGAGTLLGDIDRAGQKHGLVVPSGTNSLTGVAGLTLGGGIGMLMRRYGATVDNLESCDVVTIDGRKIVASESENPDLFWALRGGGGNFGVVTAFEYRGHPVGPEVMAGTITFPPEQIKPVVNALREKAKTMSRDLGVIIAIADAPPDPEIPAEYHGKPVLTLFVVYSGKMEGANETLESLTSLGSPAAVQVVPMEWADANSMLDVIAPWGRSYHTRGGYLPDLPEALLDMVIERAESAPRLDYESPGVSTAQTFAVFGGAISEDFSEDYVAFSREGAVFLSEIITAWDKPEDAQRFEGWADGIAEAMAPYMRKNGYINLTTDRGPAWLRELYGAPEKFKRLQAAKKKWDPMNLLRFNKNILPD
ncbi:FAD-binding oxidoreductase [Henriciella aquimarina]|uniref:FAD-binding oxidoreductase n=1 Tax=Henriciella aquimarina TaxID=545261 RepID=UPI0009FCF717|nr:FAD-binding oxidoreductase [Henriciella aquimarina]